MSRAETGTESRRGSRSRKGPGSSEAGFTLVEMLIVLLVFSVVAVLATTLITSFISNLTSATATYQGIDQAELSSRTFTQYLRAATAVETAAPNELAFSAYVGMSATAAGSPAAPVEEQIDVQLEPFTSTLDVLQIYFGYDAKASNPLATARLVAAYDVLPPPAGGGIFSYFNFTQNELTPLSFSAAAAALSSIEAVGLDLTFLSPAGPRPRRLERRARDDGGHDLDPSKRQLISGTREP